jgi:sulfide:quinone oxidoreductase
MEKHFGVVVVGGGTAGITVAAQLLRREPSLSVAIIEPSADHYYQPIWTLVGGGAIERASSVRPQADFIPANADWLRDSVADFDPEQNRLTTVSGEVIAYDWLVVAAGIQINWDAIPGLRESIGHDGVCSNYSYDTVESTWETLRSFEGGTALFTHPNTPIKCGGAPQKACYLTEDYLRRHGLREESRVIYSTPWKNIFPVQKYRETLAGVVKRRDIETRFETHLTEVRAASREAVLTHLESGETEVISYDMLHVTPPMGPPDFIASSLLADSAGWVDVDKSTLQHTRFLNVFSLGDCSSLPTSKTGAAVRKQAPVLVANLLGARQGRALDAEYDGYTSCPLVTGYGSLVLAEFDYDGVPAESFPFDQAKERRSMYLLKVYGLPLMYWHGMLRGRV